MATADTTSMVARVALIMNLFDDPGKRLRLDQVVSRTGLPRSRCTASSNSCMRLGCCSIGPTATASPPPRCRWAG
ncbi:hypothetical protein C1Y40_05551 [Mycobacterium talmoniae]|uniref:Uncharacterized protein n=1 Tax=Mycobacterium talmoniae TaxID=1858794 RepID=A0A2S8BCA8_9MYCO|nr:hypothetical protein C1Y40_05551 [Mycobacterium talmoniae]